MKVFRTFGAGEKGKVRSLGMVTVLLSVLLTIPARAEVIPPVGENTMKLVSVSSHWRDGEALAPGAGLELGDELRAVMSITSLHNPGTDPLAYWSRNASEEITGLVYDLELMSFGGTGLDSNGLPQQGTILYYSPAQRNGLTSRDDLYGLVSGGGDISSFSGTWGGVSELYYDSSADLNTLMGTDPSSWVEGNPSRDAFPGATDGNLWLSGVFLELNAMGVESAPKGAVYMIEFITGANNASGYGFINVFDGSVASRVDYSAFAPFVDATFATTVNLNPDGSEGWQAVVNDPIRFEAVPEPGSLLLLGTGAWLLGRLRRRRN